MNKRIKTGFLAFLLTAGISFSVFAQTPTLSDLQNGVMDFSETLAKSLPFNSSLGLNWSDAYIGKIFPGIPPHFGVGGSFGITTMKLPVMKELAGFLGYDLPFDMGKMVLPAYAVEARIGGFFLPFDIGAKIGYLPPVTLWGSNMDVNYLLAGADLRYAILDGKSNLLIPSLSVGVGLNYLKGGVGGKVGSSQTINYGDSGFITLDQPDVELVWETISLDFKAQLSKSFLIITPYIGLGGSYAWSKAGYSVETDVNFNGASIQDIQDYLAANGLEGIDIDSAGLSSIVKNGAFSFRAFGGLSVNMAVFRLDLTGLYSFLDNNFGVSFGFRFQL